jgi:hypothetical protein
MNSVKKPPSIWEGQFLHLSIGVILIALVSFIWVSMDQPFPIVFWCSIAIPILHQVFVWLTWRFELLSASISKTIGFQVYLVFFFLLFGGRFISVFWLAYLDQGSLGLSVYPRAIIATIALLLGLYTMYSVKRYFGMARAAGADHFNKRYRSMPLVKEGIFRFTSNAMYVYAFLIFWAIAVGFNSAAAFAVVAFSHAYIWVHFYSTEKPDMDFLYASSTEWNHS